MVTKVPSEIKLCHRGDSHPLLPRASSPGSAGGPGLYGIVGRFLSLSQVTPSLMTLKRPRLPSKTVSNQVQNLGKVALESKSKLPEAVLVRSLGMWA